MLAGRQCVRRECLRQQTAGSAATTAYCEFRVQVGGFIGFRVKGVGVMVFRVKGAGFDGLRIMGVEVLIWSGLRVRGS